MAIVTKKKKVQAAQGAGSPTSTHFRNETTKPLEEINQPLKNHMAVDKLTDPEDTTDEAPGSTHFQNETTFSKKTNRLNANAEGKKPVKATELKPGNSKPKAGWEAPVLPAKEKKNVPLDGAGEKGNHTMASKSARRLKASEEDKAAPGNLKVDDTTFTEGEDEAFAGFEGEPTPNVAEDDTVGQQDTQHMDNNLDPAAGYLTVGSEDEFDDDLEDDEDEVDADALAEDAGSTPQSLLEAGDDWDPDTAVVSEFDDEDEDGEDDEEEGEEGSEEDDTGTEAAVETNADDMSVLDIDGTDDEGDDAAFAAMGMTVHVIKANRIVASLGKKRAVKAGHGDVYLSDEFQDVVAVEMSKHGLRAGLQKMGFALATINVAKNEVVNKRVEAKAKQVTAAVRRSTHSSNEALGQCLAIAAVGINRQYFKDSRNELRASLEEELEAAGVRNASRLVRKVFASKGVDYAKSILTLATKLVNMPEVTRNQFAAALDMTSEDMEDDPDADFAEDTDPDFVTSEADDFDDEFEDDIESPASVHAALSRPAKHIKREVKASSAGYSVNALAVLDGKAPLPFI